MSAAAQLQRSKDPEEQSELSSIEPNAIYKRIVRVRNGKPCAQLVPLDPSPRRQLGFLPGRVDAAFFEPLPGDELERWRA